MQAATNVADTVMGKKPVPQGTNKPLQSSSETMKAVTYLGAKDVVVAEVPKPLLTHPSDAIVRVTLCAICSGSDTNIYSGEQAGVKSDQILGHEAVGIVEAVGSAVTKLSVGDRVAVACNIACGACDYCKREEYSGCVEVNDSVLAEKAFGHCPGATFGYGEMLGGVPGSQAQFVRVPIADVNCLKIPEGIDDEKAVLATDVLATSLHAAVLAEVKEGDTVAIWGLGPVGLCAARWCQIKGAKRVIGIDVVPERLSLAAHKLGIDIIDRSQCDSVPSKIMELVPGGVDAAIEAAGFRYPTTVLHAVQRAVGLETDAPDIIIECFTAVRKYGRIALIGDYAGTANQFPIGQIMMKHLTLKAGQVPMQKYFGEIMDRLKDGSFDPAFVVSHRVAIDEAPEAYQKLFSREQGYIKVLMSPA